MVLFELMIALTIFVVAVVALVMALDASMDSAQERNEIAAATTGLDNQLALLHSAPLAACDKDLPPDGSPITYHLAITPKIFLDQKNAPVPGMYEATVTARWKSDGQPEDRTLVQLFYQP